MNTDILQARLPQPCYGKIHHPLYTGTYCNCIFYLEIGKYSSTVGSRYNDSQYNDNSRYNDIF